jgi:hypothetical protein
MNKTWKRVKYTNLPNLHVLSVDGKEVGFVTKPNDDKFNKNMWRVFKGIGYEACMLCHESGLPQAKQTLEKELNIP